MLPEFDKCWNKLGLTDDDLWELQDYLCLHPESGDINPDTGGLRKLRWGLQTKGKRGGARVIYVDFAYYEKLYLISAYSKSDKDNLTKTEKTEIRKRLKVLEAECKK
jgi:hypothetical protein